MNSQNTFQCLTKSIFCESDFYLVPIREKDMQEIRQWRNDQIKVLRQTKIITSNEQKKYYQNNIMKTFSQDKPEMILFSFLVNDECVGYGGLTNIDWINKVAEVSFLLKTDLINNKKIYGEYFSNFLTILKRIAFEEIELKKTFTETFDIRPEHIKILEYNGFVFIKRIKKHIYQEHKFIDSIIHELIRK